jgi:NAD(P)-dependent dehydrogenase (short-subunit alcohol dehydrogenase family)
MSKNNKTVQAHEFSADTLVALTGATGGLGKELCRMLLQRGAALVLLDRNAEKSAKLHQQLTDEFPNARIMHITVDLERIEQVRSAVEKLKKMPVSVFIHNAGAYSIPRHKCSTGFDNVFQINFVSPYYMIRELLPHLKQQPNAKVIAVGSIAHNYSHIDTDDIDFSSRKAASKVYGNAKRYLMFSLYELFAKESGVSLSIVHPGITLTNITAHYPKLIFALIKYPMKVIFMSPRRAALSLIQGVWDACGYREWIGPRFFNIWGLPKKSRLNTCSEEESRRIGQIAEDIYRRLSQLKQ